MTFDAEMTALAARGCPSDEFHRFARKHEGHFRALASYYLKAFPLARKAIGPEDALAIVTTATWQALRRFDGEPETAVKFVRHYRHRALRKSFGSIGPRGGHRSHMEGR